MVKAFKTHTAKIALEQIVSCYVYADAALNVNKLLIAPLDVVHEYVPKQLQ